MAKWTSDVVYLNGLDLFSSVVDRFPVDAWGRPSPCAGWRALDVLGHVTTATNFGISLMKGETPSWQPSDRPGDSITGDPAESWRRLATEARQLVAQVDLKQEVDTPMGRRTVAEGLSFPAVDLFVHAWDLGRTAGIEVEIPPEAAEFTQEVLGRMPADQLRSPSVFAAEAEAAAGATPTEAYIAWTGRDPRWAPASGS